MCAKQVRLAFSGLAPLIPAVAFLISTAPAMAQWRNYWGYEVYSSHCLGQWMGLDFAGLSIELAYDEPMQGHGHGAITRVFRLLAAMAAVFVMCLEAPAAGKRTIVGTIRDYTCGDNCYLTIVDARGKKHDGLCTASLCQAWNKAVEMPKRFVGRKVRVTVTKGMQVNDNGDPMGPFPAFRKIELLD